MCTTAAATRRKEGRQEKVWKPKTTTVKHPTPLNSDYWRQCCSSVHTLRWGSSTFLQQQIREGESGIWKRKQERRVSTDIKLQWRLAPMQHLSVQPGNGRWELTCIWLFLRDIQSWRPPITMLFPVVEFLPRERRTTGWNLDDARGGGGFCKS